MSHKKTLYEILEVPASADYGQIRAAHERLLQALQAQAPGLDRDDYSNRARLLKMAFGTLSTPLSRDAYDAQLSLRNAPAAPRTALLVSPPAAPASNAAALRADAMMMRADALALRADALGLKADVLGSQALAVASADAPAIGRVLRSSLRTILLTLGTVAAGVMIIKVVLLFLLSRAADGSGSGAGMAQERAFFEEYYQAHGVRPTSRAQAQALDAERERLTQASREQAAAAEEKRRSAREQVQWEAESRRTGQQVTRELQHAEDMAVQTRQYEQRREEEQKQAREERAQYLEQQRLQAEQAKWRRVLDAPNKY